MTGAVGRTIAIVDGFNVYFALRNNPRLARYKWLDYKRVCNSVMPRSVLVDDVTYCTAIYVWDADGVRRHRTYIRALKHTGVSVCLGKFKRRNRICRAKCGMSYRDIEEKQTDVNIAIQLLTKAHNDEFDTALIMTGDTDLLPLIDTMHETFPAKRLGFLLPPGRRAKAIVEAADFHIKLKERHFASCQLPDRIALRDGVEILRPGEW